MPPAFHFQRYTMDIVHSRESQLLGLNSFKNKNHKVTMGVLKISLEILDFSLGPLGAPLSWDPTSAKYFK